MKIKLITYKQQNITKIENTTNEKQRHPQCLMMINYPLLWHSNPKPCGSSSIRLVLHPNFHLDLGHIEKEQTHFQVTMTSTIIPSPS